MRLCNSPSIHDLLLGPLTRPGWGVPAPSSVGFFLPPRPALALPLFLPPGLKAASTPHPSVLQGWRPKPQKVKCPLLDRVGFVLWIPGWLEEGCAHSACRPLSPQHFSAINNPLQMPQIPGPGSPEGAPTVGGLGGWRQGKASSPLPRKQATLEIPFGGNEGWPWPPPVSQAPSSPHPRSREHFDA